MADPVKVPKRDRTWHEWVCDTPRLWWLYYCTPCRRYAYARQLPKDHVTSERWLRHHTLTPQPKE